MEITCSYVLTDFHPCFARNMDESISGGPPLKFGKMVLPRTDLMSKRGSWGPTSVYFVSVIKQEDSFLKKGSLVKDEILGIFVLIWMYDVIYDILLLKLYIHCYSTIKEKFFSLVGGPPKKTMSEKNMD